MAFEPKEITNWEHDNIIAAKRVELAGTSLQTIIDESTDGTTYVGKGARGLATSATGWLIEKIVVGGTTTTITHAIDAWDNRATTAVYS